MSTLLVIFIMIVIHLSQFVHVSRMVEVASQCNLTEHRLNDYKQNTDKTIQRLTETIDFLQNAYAESEIRLAAVENVAIQTQNAFIELVSAEMQEVELDEEPSQTPKIQDKN